MNNLEKLETAYIKREVAHTESHLEDKLLQLETLATDWAYWDANYHFLENYNQDFINNHVTQNSLSNVGIDGMVWVTKKKEAHFGLFLDDTKTPSEILLNNFTTQHLGVIDALTRDGKDLSSKNGLMVFNQQVHLLSMMKVLKSDGSGSFAGWLICLKRIPNTIIYEKNDELNSLVQLKPSSFIGSTVSLGDNDIEPNVLSKSKERITFTLQLRDIYDKSNIELSSDIPRTIIQRVEESFIDVFYVELLLSACAAIFTFYYLRKHISTPISKLVKNIENAPSLEQVRLSKGEFYSEDLSKLVNILQSAITKLNENMETKKADQARVNHQNRVLFELANDKDLNDGHLHQSFYKILSTFVHQTGAQRASIWMMDQDLNFAESYACVSQHGNNISNGTQININQITKHLLTKLIRQRSFTTELNKHVAKSMFDFEIHELAIICPIIIGNEVKGALIAEFNEEQRNILEGNELFLASLSELSTNSLYAHERKKLQDQLDHMAHHDALTDLPNRSFFKRLANQAIARARRERSGFTLFFIDLDNFKPVNDKYGHSAGDELLIHVSKRINERIRESDTLARIGGDEFLILLEDTKELPDARLIATEIIEAIGRPFLINEHQIRVSCSIGISIYPQHGYTIDQLISASDQAMYHVKSTGRANISIAQPILRDVSPISGDSQGKSGENN